VKVVGMTRREAVDPAVDESRTFRSASRRNRLLVVAAGPLVNLGLGLVLLVLAAGFDPGAGQDPGAKGAVTAGWRATSMVTTGTLEGIGQLVTDLDGYLATLARPSDADEAPTRFLSPVGVAQISDEVAGHGPWTVVRLVGIVSLGLGVMNLLPFPPLDGGHAAVVGVEWAASKVLRRPALRLDVASPGIAALTAMTLVFVLLLGASAVVFDIASPVSL
jgi:regulator of sigma E protease